MLEGGARIVGGCCGTTPAHIRAMREAVDRHALGAGRPSGRAATAPTVALEREETRPSW